MRNNLMYTTEYIFVIVKEKFAYFSPISPDFCIFWISVFFDQSKNIKIVHIFRPEEFRFTENWS